jgi:hypothetical protein
MPSTPLHGTSSTNVYLNAIQWGGWQWTDAPAGTNIAYYFGGAGQNLNPASFELGILEPRLYS